jgi:hypothetical protein
VSLGSTATILALEARRSTCLADRQRRRKEVKRVNIETLERPIEPAASILKGN